MFSRPLPLEKRTVRRSRRARREQRRLARELARQHSADTLAVLLQEQTPDWMNQEQADAYVAEVKRLYRRVVPRTHARAASA